MEYKPMYEFDDLGYGVTITRLSDNFSCFLQGDDAGIFLDEIDSIENPEMQDYYMGQYDVIMEEPEDG